MKDILYIGAQNFFDSKIRGLTLCGKRIAVNG